MKRILAALFGALLLCTSLAAAERARELSKKDLNALLASSANTARDHLRLASHFEAKALKYEAEAAEHAASAKMYRARPTASEQKHPMGPETAAHCDYLADSLAKAAKEARAMAAAHAAMAKK